MAWIEWLGLLSGALISCGFFAQVLRIYKLKSAHGISMLFTILLMVGALCWIVYGIYLTLVAIVFWNSLMLIVGGYLFYAKLKYGN